MKRRKFLKKSRPYGDETESSHLGVLTKLHVRFTLKEQNLEEKPSSFKGEVMTISSATSAPMAPAAFQPSPDAANEAAERVPDNEAAEAPARAPLPQYLGNRVDTTA